jgi:hypothetical protein
VSAQYVWDTKKNYLPPGVTVNYYYQIEDAAGHKLKTASKPYVYTDTRHTWKTLTANNLSLSWYLGSDAFGKALFDAEAAAMAQLQKDAGVTVQQPVSIWIYDTYEELRGSMAAGAQEWTGGVSYSDMGVILIGVPENRLDWGKRAVAHELSHVVVDQATHNPFGDIPRWLNEGLAMYAEGPMEANYKTALGSAVSQRTLISLKSISSNFPADSDAASLSYAESLSVVQFLIDTYGRDKMAALLATFKEGSTYDSALRKVYGLDTNGLDSAWQASLGIQPQSATASPRPSAAATPTRPPAATPTPGTGYLPSGAFVLIGAICVGALCIGVAVAIILLITMLARRTHSG